MPIDQLPFEARVNVQADALCGHFWTCCHAPLHPRKNTPHFPHSIVSVDINDE